MTRAAYQYSHSYREPPPKGAPVRFNSSFRPHALAPRHPHFARLQTGLTSSNNNASVLTNWKTTKYGLDTTEHGFGIRAKEEDPSFLSTLPGSPIATIACCNSDVCENRVEVEVGIDLIREAE
jgi:hypothetical protein